MKRTHVAGCAIGVTLVLAACGLRPLPDDPCETDPSKCPTSSRTADVVTCACRCERRSGVTQSSAYAGDVAFCLPARLNAKLASPEQRADLGTMSETTFNQSVFRFCSEDVARFVDRLVERQQGRDPRIECIGAVSCSCTTKGAYGESAACARPCEDVACSEDNCPLVLRHQGRLSTMGCGCTRVGACGGSAPSLDQPPLCAPPSDGE